MSGTEWMDRAACRGEDVNEFYRNGPMSGRLRDLCGTCPVRAECLAYAMRVEAGRRSADRHGVWGGTTAEKRARMAGGEAA